MSKIDFKKELKHLYRPSAKEFAVVDVPPMKFLMIDGHGDPNTAQEYQDAVEALYAVSYKLKFVSKKELGKDYVVCIKMNKVLLLSGTCGSGKTTISKLMAEHQDWERICEDDIWLELFGKDRGDPRLADGMRKRAQIQSRFGQDT